LKQWNEGAKRRKHLSHIGDTAPSKWAWLSSSRAANSFSASHGIHGNAQGLKGWSRLSQTKEGGQLCGEVEVSTKNRNLNGLD
jgi:hypothetical protein